MRGGEDGGERVRDGGVKRTEYMMLREGRGVIRSSTRAMLKCV